MDCLNLPPPEGVNHLLNFLLNSDHEEEHEGGGVPGAGACEEEKQKVKDGQNNVKGEEVKGRELCAINQGCEEDWGLGDGDRYKNDRGHQTIHQEWGVDYKDFLNWS